MNARKSSKSATSRKRLSRRQSSPSAWVISFVWDRLTDEQRRAVNGFAASLCVANGMAAEQRTAKERGAA